ncbi:hypothetical protein F7725_028809 [Dissostichus mawsoni]|uniref:Uncharacterized protein n=1 Tax=Dissostichus mawsoni TaxID=36200 RepID=A0A7J5XH48_DISMA|nr:hypothetical protein F7725_028809 [Dissostichus mawsoni]
MHISIQEGRSLPNFQRCTTCCEDFHCPFCASNVFHPAKSSKVQTHLESHFNRAVLYEGKVCKHSLVKCKWSCNGIPFTDVFKLQTTISFPLLLLPINADAQSRLHQTLALCKSQLQTIETYNNI